MGVFVLGGAAKRRAQPDFKGVWKILEPVTRRFVVG